MKTSNVNQGRAHPEAIIRGWVSNKRAGPTGITIGDGTHSVPDIIELTVDGGTIVFTEDGKALLIVDNGGLPWFNVEDYGAVHDNSTDDTVAIQAAIQACFDAGGGVVYFPDGIYVIGGALQDPTGVNAQIVLPMNEMPPTGTAPQISIELRGMSSPVMGYWFFDVPPPTAGPILRSTLDPAISGSPAVIAGAAVDADLFGGGSNWLQLIVRNMTIRLPDNPKLTGIQARGLTSFFFDNLVVDTNASRFDSVQPTHSNSIGIDCTNINAIQTVANNAWVVGFYTGYRANENLTVVGDIWAEGCYRALEFTGMYHVAHIKRMSIVHCPYGIVFSGPATQGGLVSAPDGRSFVVINELDIQHADTADWHAVVADIYDPNNYAHGFIAWFTDLGSFGVVDNLVTNGAAHLSYHNIAFDGWTLNNVVHIPRSGTDPSTNPSNGGVLYAASANDHPSWRTAGGTVYDLTTGSPTAAQVRDAGRWEPTVDGGTDTLIFDNHTVVMDWTTS